MSLPAAEVAQLHLETIDAPAGLRTPSGVNSGMLGGLWPFGGEHPWLTMLTCHDSLQACSAFVASARASEAPHECPSTFAF